MLQLLLDTHSLKTVLQDLPSLGSQVGRKAPARLIIITTNVIFLNTGRTFTVCGPSIWNQITPHIRNLHSVPDFHKALKMPLFSHQF